MFHQLKKKHVFNFAGGQSVQYSAVQNKGQQHGVPNVQHSGGVYTNNLYPDLNQDLDSELVSVINLHF